MKQIFQSLESGETFISEIPIPSVEKGHLLIRSTLSLISSGTERMLINFGKSNIISKAKGQPDRVREVIQKIKTDGPITTYNAVKNKLEEPIPLGYCNVGEIIEVGEGVENFQVGDRVVSNGPHAEIVSVPKNLSALIPNVISNEEAVFTIPASIGLQGIRLLKPTFGETVLVIGLGLIGLLTAQLLKSQGCRVIGLDIDRNKCLLAESFGIETIPFNSNDDIASTCYSHTNNHGVDGVIITASTKSDDPIIIAAKSCRKRGRIILIGITGLKLKRDLFYEKEISFQVSCSYGPGRYDLSYEKEGNDYPIGFVRWTEQRNFEAILAAMKSKQLNLKNISHELYDIEKANLAYKSLIESNNNHAILIKYKTKIEKNSKKIVLRNDFNISKSNSQTVVGVVGSGNYSSRYILPSLFKKKVVLKTIVASSGLKPFFFGKKFNFYSASTDSERVIKDPSINTIFIATRHDSHCQLVIDSLKNNKNIYVEKPLCISKKELYEIEETFNKVNLKNIKNNTKAPILMVGFNRRFSPHIQLIKKKLSDYTAPKSFVYTINAGYIPQSHWTQNSKLGGGRLIGEACHFLDLLRFLSGEKIQKIEILNSYKLKLGNDTFSLQVQFMEGSIGNINYFANGNKGYPKEKIEIFFSGKIITLENFRKIKSWGLKNFPDKSSLIQQKGNKECIHSFIDSIEKGYEPPINIKDIFEIQSNLLNLNS